ncbi:MAG: hypothetical protein DYG92_09470 [Leptolyngbya sp. PLA1]|nr:hypothetical protein [Leptolyngbya sp. PLA1]
MMEALRPPLSADTAALEQSRGVSLWLDPIRHAMGEKARTQRVIALVVASSLMSLGDLYMTLTYVTSVGMIELNPLARGLMNLNSPLLVIVWKVALTVFGAGVILLARRKRLAEAAAWVVFLAMAFLTIHWSGFNREVAEMTEEYHMLANIGDERFVQMGE